MRINATQRQGTDQRPNRNSVISCRSSATGAPLGEVVDHDDVRRDIQLKGSGRTPFSRGGDGRAALGPVLREYVVSEAMAALGVRTTRSLAAVLTGEPVYRERILPGAILTRVASSHIRVGTFQHLPPAETPRHCVSSRTMRSTVIIPRPRRHPIRMTACSEPSLRDTPVLLRSGCWLASSHGVMNTDNTSIAGENNPPFRLSRLHFMIPRSGEQLLVSDLGSRLGTIVNGQAIGHHFMRDAAPLSSGENDILAGGRCSLFEFIIHVD